jgi:hypothetical protein
MNQEQHNNIPKNELSSELSCIITGLFFEQVTGKKTSDFNSQPERELAIEQATGRKIKTVEVNSSLIEKSGSIFPLRSVNMSSVNREIDKHIKKMKKITAYGCKKFSI